MTVDWQEAVRGVIERLVGEEASAEIAARWDEHVARGRVELTLLGPYSSGKSTLLRRLVADDGGAVPSWLTVSARRETFELNAVDVGHLTLTDAPGFGAGNELHDELARDALALSDAFLLVVPPQLLTTDRELVASIVSGQYFFGRPRAGSEASVLAVVAQADSMGIDPEDDLEGMRQLADRKRSELADQLQAAARAPLPDLQVFCVAADPYEEQARRPDPTRSDFDPYRGWDGIDALRQALDELPGRYEQLLHEAELRYFARVAADVASQAQAVVDELRASAEDLRARHLEWEQQKASVEAVIEAAKADLHAALLDLAGDLGDVAGGDEAQARAEIEGRMAEALTHWARRWDGQLDLALGAARVSVDDRLGSTRARRTDDFLRSLAVDEEPTGTQPGNSHIVELLNNINGELQSSARKTLELYAGMPIDKLRAKGPRQAAAAAAEGAKEGAAKAVSRLRGVGVGLEVVNGVLAIATVIDADRRQQAADAERTRARAAARERLERDVARASAEIVHGTPDAPGWRAPADEALDRLRQQLGLSDVESAIDDLLASIEDRQHQISQLRDLLTRTP